MERLVVGIVRTSHGVKGYVKVMSLSGEQRHFLNMKEVHLIKDNIEKDYRIEEVKLASRDVLMKFVGIDTPEEGKRLAGAEIWVDREFAAPLDTGEYYVSDIVGCSLIFKGEKVGSVVSVIENGISDLLEVRSDSGTRIVPLTEQFVGAIDVDRRIIELKDDWVLQ